MKNKKLAPLLTLVMSFELMIAPVAANAQTTNSSGTNNTLNIINSAMSTLGQGYNQMSNSRASVDMASLQQQQTPIPDGTFNANKLLSKLPGLGDYLAKSGQSPAMLSCDTLPSTLYVVKNEVCGDIGITNLQGQADEAYAYFNQYLHINRVYYNYTMETANQGETLYGISCMNNAMKILQGYFNDRSDELDRLVAKIVEMNKNFEETSKVDLNAIEDATALLNGDGAGELLSKLRSRPGFKDDDLDFGKKFSDAACSSMYSAQDYNSMGSKGLIGINDNVKSTLNAPVGNPAFSGATYSKSNAEIVSDIQKLANNMSNIVKSDFSTLASGGYSSFAGSASSKVGSAYNINQILNQGFFSDLQTKFTESRNTITKEVSALQSELGSDSAAALSFISDPEQESNFAAEVTALENKIKNDCMAKSVDVDDIIAKLYDPINSKFANQNNTKTIKKRMEDIINNMTMSPAKKLSELQAIESQSGNRYVLRMNAPYEVQEIGSDGQITRRTVSPSAGTTTTSYYSDVVKNCEAQFKANKLNNKYTGQAAIQKLRDLKNSYNKLATTHAQDVKKEITDRLIECRDSATATSSSVGSCTSERFNTSSANFCAKAALSCSTNMQSCAAQTEKVVKDTKNARDVRLTRYKENVQKNIAELRKMYSTALSKYMNESQILNSAFGASFTTPSNADKQDITDGSQYNALLKGVSPESILVEDPAKFVSLFQDKIKNLKTAVVAQQKTVLESLTKSKDATKDNLAKVLEQSGGSQGDGSGGIASKCLANYNAAIKGQLQADQESAKKQSELGEKRSEYCSLFGTGNTSINDICDGGDIGELTKDVLKMNMSSDDKAQAVSLKAYCGRRENESDFNAKAYCKNPANKSNCKEYTNAQSCVDNIDANKPIATLDGMIKISNPEVDFADCKPIFLTKIKKLIQSHDKGLITPTDWAKILKDAKEEVETTESALVKSSNLSSNSPSNSAPAFCTAGDNSGPYNTKSGLGQQGNDLLKTIMGANKQ